MTTYRFALRRGTAAAWTAANPILADGEPGLERDTRQWRIGDGVTQWSGLPYFGVPLVDPAAGVAGSRTLGTAATQAAPGNVVAGHTTAITDIAAALVDKTTAQTITGNKSWKGPGDAAARLTIDAATGNILGGRGTATPVLALGIASNGVAWQVTDASLKLRAVTSNTIVADLHYHSKNGCGADFANWGLGIDVLGGRPDPVLGPTGGLPARDFAIYKFLANGFVVDFVYLLNRGGNYMPTMGLGNGAAQNTHLLTLTPDSGEAALGGLLLWLPSGQTGAALTVKDSGATDRLWIDNVGTIRGAHFLAGSAVCIQADATNNRPLVFRDNSLVPTYWGWQFNTSGFLKFRYITGGTDVMQIGADGTVFFYASPTINADLIMNGVPKWAVAGNAQTTVGAAGGASALPATPTKFLKVRDSAGTMLVVPAYAS